MVELKGRGLSIAAITMFILIGLVSSTTGAYAATTPNSRQIFIVDINGGSDYTSIQEAIDNANSGDTVFVKKGVYSEVLEIKKTITLQGEDKAYTIINPISENYAIRIRKESGVEISDLSITNRGTGLYTTAIYLSSSNTYVYNCKIYDTPIGIAIWSSDNTIENCIFYGCSDEGIAVLGTREYPVENTKIINSNFYDNCDAIELQGSINTLIQNCLMYDNTHAGIDAITSDNNHNTIDSCKIDNNGAFGVFLSHSSDNKIINCRITGNDDDIFTTDNSYNNEITDTFTTKDLEQETVEEESSIESLSLSYNNDGETKNNLFKNLLNILSNLNFYKIISLIKLP